MEPDIKTVLSSLQTELTRTRKDVLDILELAFREHPNWQYVRTRVLRALGRSGLEGTIDSILKQNDQRIGADHE